MQYLRVNKNNRENSSSVQIYFFLLSSIIIYMLFLINLFIFSGNIIQNNNNWIISDLTEDEFLNVTTKTKKCLVHFYHPDFRRCDIMHTHLLVRKKNES